MDHTLAGERNMKKVLSKLAVGAALCASMGFAIEVDLHPGYSIMTLRPTGFEPQVSGMDFMPNGDMIVLTWRGTSGPGGQNSSGIQVTTAYTGTTRLYRVTNTKGSDPTAITVTEIASGFKDAQGLCIVNGEIYVGDVDRIVKMVDKDKDGKYEEMLEIGKIPSYMGWFEYSFGPVHKDGKLYMALASGVQSSGWPEKSLGKDRGSVISIPITGGAYTVVATGLRAPDGIGIGPEGEIWVTDNQGGWRPTSPFIQIKAGKFYGYLNQGETIPAGTTVTPPNLWAPFRDANDSPTEPALMNVGPYKGQFIYGDIGRGGIYRAFLEKVNGEYQGSVITMSGGLEVGVHRIRTGAEGEIYIGGLGANTASNQGWNFTNWGLQKLVPNNTPVFEILATRSRATGMELEFTMPVGKEAGAAANYVVKQWGYVPDNTYGGGMGKIETRTIKSVQVSPDRKRVFLEIDGLKTGQVVAIAANNLKSEVGAKVIWYNKTWYTLNAISPSQPFEPSVEIRHAAMGSGQSGMQVRRMSDRLRITFSDGAVYKLEILDFQGRALGGDNSATGSAEIAIRGARPGLHIVRAMGAGRTFSVPIVL